MIQFHAREHEMNGRNGRVRVWQSTWASDQFNVVAREDFIRLAQGLDQCAFNKVVWHGSVPEDMEAIVVWSGNDD